MLKYRRHFPRSMAQLKKKLIFFSSLGYRLPPWSMVWFAICHTWKIQQSHPCSKKVFLSLCPPAGYLKPRRLVSPLLHFKEMPLFVWHNPGAFFIPVHDIFRICFLPFHSWSIECKYFARLCLLYRGCARLVLFQHILGSVEYKLPQLSFVSNQIKQF